MKPKKSVTELLKRIVSGIYLCDDVQALANQMATEDLSCDDGINRLTDNIWEESSYVLTSDLEKGKYEKEARKLLRQKQTRRISFVWKVSAAAMILFLVSMGSVNYFHYMQKESVIIQKTATSYGETKKLTLADGTKVTLNACSNIRYPDKFIEDERRVQLQGEGYFVVSRDEEHPFVVNVGNMQVKVLGTQFNVKAYANNDILSVGVNSGEVQVEIDRNSINLKANEEIIYNVQSKEFVKQAEAYDVNAWKNGILRFNRTTVHDVAKELERLYKCRIVLDTNTKFDNRISGEHENSSLEAVLSSLKLTSGIKYKKLSDNTIVLYK